MTDIFPVPVDWNRILDELRDAGWSGYAVAKAIGRKWDTVQGWRTHEPRHADGVALLALHARECRPIGSTGNIPAHGDTEKTV